MSDIIKALGISKQAPQGKTSQDNLTQVLVDDPVALVDDSSASVGSSTTIDSDIRVNLRIDKAVGS